MSLLEERGSADYLLSTQNLKKWFPKRGGVLGNKVVSYVKAVDGVSLGIKKGETLGLVGESGCGKTTLARTILRLTDLSSGAIWLEGKDISKIKGRKLGPFRKRMQMVFQDPYASLDPRQNIRSALLEPIGIHHVASSRKEASELCESLIEKVGLNPDHLARFPHEFSGGQRQRIAIAIALAVKPEFLVLDEPTSSLDVSVQSQMLSLLRALQKEFDLTYLFVSHNLAVISQMCDRIAVMYRGRIVELAEAKRIFENPKHPYTQTMLQSVPIPDPKQRNLLKAKKAQASVSGNAGSDIAKNSCRYRFSCEYATEKCSKEEPPFVEIEKDHWIECHYDIDFS